jgi:hypothetical protein
MPGRIVSESLGPFHMTSVAYFEKWGREPAERILGTFDGGVIHIHGNGRKPEEKRTRARQLTGLARPILMNEDDNGRATTVENLESELASCSIFFEQAAGWGYMPWVQAQRFPFRFMPAEASRP